jgi:hemoglobin
MRSFAAALVGAILAIGTTCLTSVTTPAVAQTANRETAPGITQATTQDPLYHQLGDQPGIARITKLLLAEVVVDKRTKDDFENTNLDRLQTRLTDFLCVVAGGPCTYKGQSMRQSHASMHLTQAKFNALVEDLQSAMRQADVPFRTQNRLLARLAPMERDIVTR